MFVGHALAAFALVATIARLRGWDDQRALRVGILAGLFAAAPDLDILYGPVGLLGGVSGLSGATDAFWETGNVVHRGPTHSLIVGAVAATAFAALRGDRTVSKGFGVATLCALTGFVALFSGLLPAVVTVLFLVGGVLVVALAVRWEVPARIVGGAALAGLFTHPFGDLLTGSPPSLLYPFDVVVVSERVVLHSHETVNLIGAFLVELTVVWAALAVAFSLTGRSVREHVDRRAVLGFGYGGAVLVLPAPTLETSYQFVFSVLALGVVGVPGARVRRVDVPRVACTGLAAVTAAALAFALAYALV